MVARRLIALLISVSLVSTIVCPKGFLLRPHPAIGTPYDSRPLVTVGEQPDPKDSICGVFYRRVIDKQVKSGSKVTFRFDPFQEDEDSTDMQCFATLYNGQLDLHSTLQKPVTLRRADNNSTQFDCRNENEVIIPQDIQFQILTVQWIWRIGGESYRYCADLYVKEGVSNQAFFNKEAAQEHLDDLGRFELTKKNSMESLSMEFSGHS